jgi:pantoate kinase
MADTVSDRLYLGRITPGMDVCDVTGEKVGSIAHIYQVDQGTGATDEATPARTGDEIFEVKTGFLGLGKHYYIPMSAVQEVLTDSIFISKSREAFAELGYEEKPAHVVETP